MVTSETSSAAEITPSNPFPVYPVQPLSELRDIRAATVETHEVRIVRDAVIDFAKTFDPASGKPPRHLVMAIKGDFGTGKTHLMLYALSLLEAEVNTAEPSTTGSAAHKSGENPTERSRSLLVAANEVSIEDWYTSVLGPALIKSVRPRELLRELMIEVAAEVAEENKKTQHFAREFRESPQQMFEVLRAGDAIDASKVELRFIERLERLASDADEDFRHCLAALRWTETAPLAERWLACAPLLDEEAKKLGVAVAGDGALRASTFIAAMAAICRHLNRPFALFVDEFEHLARYDNRNESRRNITWLKRLVEALSGQHAMVFISGHWKAWEQQGDFLDRFAGRPALQLVRLDTGDISAIVRVMAPNWTSYFLSDAAAALADVTSGNIRRVMTVLYDLYAKAGGTQEPITPKMVTETAGQRLHRAPEEGFLGTVDQGVRAMGGILERDVILSGERFDGILSGERFDGVAWLDDALRLLIRVVHARDEATLLAEGEKLADQIRAIRRKTPGVRGLFIALGAVNSEHLRTLDAARTEVDVVDGEDPEIAPKLSKLVIRALTDDQPEKPQSNAELERLRAENEQLRQLRLQVLDRSTEQIARAKEEFGSDERSTAVRDSIAPGADEVTRQKAEIEGRQSRERILAQEKEGDIFTYLTVLRNPLFYLPLILGVVVFIVGDEIATAVANSHAFPSEQQQFESYRQLYKNILLVGRLMGGALILVSLFTLFQNVFSLFRYQRYRLQTLENYFDGGAPAIELRRVRLLMDRAVDTVGPRHAATWVDVKLDLDTERRSYGSQLLK